MKKTLAAILAVVMIVSMMAGCGSSPAPTVPPTTSAPETTTVAFDIGKFKELAGKFNTTLYDTGVILSNVVDLEASYWENLNKVGGIVTSEDLVEKAKEWLHEKSDQKWDEIDSGYRRTSNFYKQMVELAPEGIEAETIFETADEMYDAFAELYNLAANPSGKFSDFVDRCNDAIHTVVAGNEKLNNLLG